MAQRRNPKRTTKSPPAKSPRGLVVLTLAFVLAMLAATVVLWSYSTGQILAYGDAEAHLNIARKLIDNRHPAYRELGTVWLPVPHLLMLPLLSIDRLYRNGLAGAIPSACCWVAAGVLLYAAIRKLAGAWEPAACALAIFAFNPNLLYLASTPMTEPVFYMELAGLLYSLASYRESGKLGSVIAAVIWSWCAVLTRYEGWLLVPIIGLFLAARRKWTHVAIYLAGASLAPLYWLAHNWWVYGDALEFYRGEWSAKAIYQRGQARGATPYPGIGHWTVAIEYYLTAGRVALGVPAMWIAAAGIVAALCKRWYWFVLLLIAAPLVTVSGMESGGGVEIFVPPLWPFSYYNSRYALALLPLAALGAAASVALMPRFRGTTAIVIALAAVIPWIAYPRPSNWVVWSESQTNSVERRAWTHKVASILGPSFRAGDRILYSFGDLTAILRESGIPLRAGLQSGNQLEWLRTIARPDLFLDQDWVLDFEDGPAASAARRLRNPGYTVVSRIPRLHKEAAVVLLRRNPPDLNN